MTPLPPIANVFKMELLWEQNGVPAANILHFQYSGGPPGADDLVQAGSTFAAGFWNNVSPGPALQEFYPPSTILSAVRCTDLSSNTGAVGEATVNSGGVHTAEASPANASALVNYSVPVHYRGGHPRTYFPPPCVDELTSPQTWDSGFLSKLTGALGIGVGDTIGATYPAMTVTKAGMVSYRTGNAPRVAPVFYAFTGLSASGLVRTQRRRVTASTF